MNIDAEAFGTKCLHGPLHILLILGRIEGASGVDKETSRTQSGPYVCENLTLPIGTIGSGFWSPFGNCHIVLAEHALARTWGIDCDEIEHGTRGCNLVRPKVGDHGIGHAPFGHVLAENPSAVSDDLVGHYQSWCTWWERLCKMVEQEGSLATRGGTKVEAYGLRGQLTLNGAHNSDQEHTGGLLNIEGTSMKLGYEGKKRSLFEVEGIGTPLNGFGC